MIRLDLSTLLAALLIPAQILFVNLLLSADNAVVIVLACRGLRPQDLQRATMMGILAPGHGLRSGVSAARAPAANGPAPALAQPAPQVARTAGWTPRRLPKASILGTVALALEVWAARGGYRVQPD